MAKIGRAHPGKNKLNMLKRAVKHLKRSGYSAVEIVWKWGSRSHEIEAKKNGVKYNFFILRVRRSAGYWLADVAGKDLKHPKNRSRTKILLMKPAEVRAMSYADFRKHWNGRSTFNLTLATRP